jgi:hypothetical protein
MSTRRWRALGAAVVLLAAALGGVARAVEVRAGETVDVTGAYDEMLFVAGEEVRIAATSTDDVIVSGGDVRFEGAALEHAFVAGGEVSFGEAVVRDLFVAGGEIDLVGGEVTDDLVATGGRIVLGPEARIGDDVAIAGADLRIEAPIGGDLRAAGGTIFLNGAVTGDVYLEGGSISIGPDTHIMGALTHRGRSVRIAPEAQIEGQTTVLRPHPKPDLRPLAALATWAAAAVLFGVFLMAMAVATAFPRLMNDVAESLRARPLSMLGLGVLIAIAAPMLVMLLAMTLLGLPLAFVIGAALALLWPVSIVGAAYAGAMLARARTRADEQPPSAGARAMWAGLAMIALILVGLVPIIGFFVWLLAYLFGLGAVAAQGWRALSKPVAV